MSREEIFLKSEADVLICDGFVGNTLLKFAESWITFFTDQIKSRIYENHPSN